MRRLDIYVKLEMELDETEDQKRIAAEMERSMRRFYGVRTVEITNVVERDD
jgi:hypothetical protein